MTGTEYADLVAAYIVTNFASRGIRVTREVNVGKSIIGKNRRIDILAIDNEQNLACAIECKYQGSLGTTDEKIPYTLQDLAAMRMPACAVYAGTGWSNGVRHLLESSPMAAFCLPTRGTFLRTTETRELDHILAQVFRWWDILLDGRSEFDLECYGRRSQT